MTVLSEHLTYENGGAVRDVSLLGAFPCAGTLTFCVTGTREPVTLTVHSDGWGRPEGERYASYALTPCDGKDSAILRLDLNHLYALGGCGLYYYEYETQGVRYGGDRVGELLPADEAGQRQLLLYDASFTTPAFLRGGMMYHIFVDRFYRSGKSPVRKGVLFHENWHDDIVRYGQYPGDEVQNDEFFGGDLYGVAEKLDYLQNLGVTVLYLSPVFLSPSNHKYDTSDYFTVDEMFGGEQALRHLCEEAHARKMRVILDGVFNHTGDDSVYFNRRGTFHSVGAYQSLASRYAPWYRFDKWPDEYATWWGVKILPKVNCDEPSYRAFLFGQEGVIRHWLRAGADGFRLDVADELSDDFVAALRRTVREEKEDGLVLGEVWEDASDKVAYDKRRAYLYGNELDSVMNYPLRDALAAYVLDGRCDTLRAATEGLYRHYPKCVSDSLMNFLGTHDTERILTVLAGKSGQGKSGDELKPLRLSASERALAVARLKTAFAVLFTVFGFPSVFYGDEAGLEGYRDPFCRRPFPWGREDDDLVSFTAKMGALRRRENVLREGWFRIRTLTPQAFVFERFDENEKLICAITRDEPFAFENDRPVRDLLSDAPPTQRLVLSPRTAYIFKEI